MILVPTNNVLAIVAKMDRQDPDSARTFLQLALYESMCDQADAARDEVEPYVLAKMADTLVSARKTLLRNHVGKAIDDHGNTDDLPYAQGMAVLETHIEKSLSGIMAAVFGRKHPRGADGRWIHASVGTGTATALTPMAAQASLHNEAQAKVDDWHDQKLITDSTPITLHHREHGAGGNPISGPGHEVKTTTTVGSLRNDARALEDNDPGKYKLEQVSVSERNKPASSNTKSRVALDIMAAAMGGDKGMGRRLMSGLPMDKDTGENKPQDANAARWNRSSSAGDRQSYRRMSMTGTLLSNISAPGSTLDTVGGLAQLIGQMGPEAEKVLGPGVRRTAYRYRGTERRPNRALVKGVNEATRAAHTLDVSSARQDLDSYDQAKNIHARSVVNTERSRLTAAAGIRGGLAPARGLERTAPDTGADPVALTNHYWMDQRVSADFRTMGMRGDAAVVNLLDTLPTKELTELGVESGEMPPSQGVIINADGKVVTQAMGYNGDHYLPFDLKNLNALHGGQYVRTRAAGGPTTEDIYTGLLSGARQIQVVSNSGVFTLEFDPDLRGGRRYSDKAGRMIARYGKLLETIVAGNIWQTDLPPEKMTELKAAALKSSRGNHKLFTEHLQVLTDEARLASSVAGEDDDEQLAEGASNFARAAFIRESTARADRGIGPMSTSEKAAVMDDARRDYEVKNKNQGARKLQLDGPGYDRALKTLRQEFPYYIRQAKWENLPDYLRTRGIQKEQEFRRFYPRDKGHVAPGQVHFIQHQIPQHASSSSSPAPEAIPDASPGAPEANQPYSIRSAVAQTSSQAGPGPKFVREMAKTVSGALSPMINIIPSGELPLTPEGDSAEARDADAASYMNPAQFVRYKLKSLEARHGEGKVAEIFTTWLLNHAPESQRNMVSASIPAVLDAVENTPDSGFSVSSVRQAGTKLVNLLDAVFPFAVAEDNPVMAEPGDRNPKPQRFPDIPNAVGVEAYDDFLADKFVADREFATTVEEFRNDYVIDAPSGSGKVFDDNAVANLIIEDLDNISEASTNTVRDPLLATLTAHQKAWSFIKARHAAKVLDKIGGSSGDADPFDFSKASTRRRTIIFHKADDPYSKLIRAKFGL